MLLGHLLPKIGNCEFMLKNFLLCYIVCAMYLLKFGM